MPHSVVSQTVTSYLGEEAFVTLGRVVWCNVCSDDKIFWIHWQINVSSTYNT